MRTDANSSTFRWHAGSLNNGLIFGAAYHLVTRLPRNASYAIGWATTWLAYQLMRDGTNGVIDNLRVVRPDATPGELRRLALLTYRSYALAASFVQRVQVLDNARSDTSGLGYVLPGALGNAEGKDAPRMKVEWRAQGLRLGGQGEGPSTLDVGTFRFDLEEESATKSGPLAKFNTPLSLREGERVVVGTSVVKDHGVVVVLTAHRVKRWGDPR